MKKYKVDQQVTLCVKNGKKILRKVGAVTQEGFGRMTVTIGTPKGMLPLHYIIDDYNPNPNMWVED